MISSSRRGSAATSASRLRNCPRRLSASASESASPGIVLQKSKIAGRRIFRENTKREAIADSYNLNHTTEGACEFNVRR